MTYQALYRTYRPRRFEDVKGQAATVSVLKNQLRTGAPAHAYLFTGPRGTGKTTVARILAMALNCEDLRDGEPCLECENCRQALAEVMPDIIEIDAASNNSVDNARDIREKVGIPPVRGKYKIYIIDEVHMLSSAAFNALLKTLEEPPDHIVFILATTELRKVLATVVSRCQRFDFRSIEETSIVERLREVTDSIGAAAEDEALLTIAREARGGLRDALTLLEKCVSAGEALTEPLVCSVLGLAGDEDMDSLLSSVLKYDEAAALGALGKILASGVTAADAAAQLCAGIQSVLYKTVTAGDEWDKRALLRAADMLCEAENAMRYSARPELLLETTVMKILLPETGSDLSSLAARVVKLEKRDGSELLEKLKQLEQRETPAPAQPLKAKKKPPMPLEARKLWEKALALAEKQAGLMPFMSAAQPVGIQGNVLIITGGAAKMQLLEANGSMKADIEALLLEAAGSEIHLKIEADAEQWELGITGLETED